MRKMSSKLRTQNVFGGVGGMKKEFIGLGLHLRPVHADHARPPFQWTLNSVFGAYENNNRRKDNTRSRQGNLEDHI